MIPNSVSVSLPTTGGNAGMINLFFHGNAPGSTTDLLIDIVGYYGPTGIAGTPGPINRISNQQIAMLRWDQDPGRAATIPVGLNPGGIAFDGHNIWVVNRGSSTVSKINPTTNLVTATIPVGFFSTWIAFDGTNIWVSHTVPGKVTKINPATNTVTDTITVGAGPAGIAFDGSNIWVANFGPDTVSKIIPF